jgi:hypothetical protein
VLPLSRLSLYRLTEGHPLLVLEALRLRALGGGAGAWPAEPGAVLDERLALLPPEAHAVLQVAAVLGREFSTGEVAATGAWSADHVAAALRTGLGASILVPGAALEQFRFSHELLRDRLSRLAFEDALGLGRRALRLAAPVSERLQSQLQLVLAEALIRLGQTVETESGQPFDLRPQLDTEGAPIVGPNRLPQLFSTDPGRALISGDPADFEAFDVPPLRGIARTAPYYHDNSAGTLEEVVDTYSRFILGFITPMKLPPVHPPEIPNSPPGSLSRDEKADLVTFLRRL